MFETGVLINPLPLRENELKRPETFSNPAPIENINNQALRDRYMSKGSTASRITRVTHIS